MPVPSTSTGPNEVLPTPILRLDGTPPPAAGVLYAEPYELTGVDPLAPPDDDVAAAIAVGDEDDPPYVLLYPPPQATAATAIIATPVRAAVINTLRRHAPIPLLLRSLFDEGTHHRVARICPKRREV